jgi:DNA polymerase-3 subunit gamma/tau
LAGNDEVARAGSAHAAAEMVLIRLAHLADMPSPEELIKQYDAAPKAPAAATSTSSNGPVAGAQGSSAQSSSAQGSSVQGSGDSSASTPVAGLSSGSASTAPAVMAQTQNAPVLQNFQAVVDMVAQKRDIGLKHALENGVHLVAFEAAAGDRAGRIELRLAEGQDNVAQELTRKLRDWTGQSWVVSLSKEQGAATIGAVKQSAADRREEAALQDPFVKSALAAFPTAEIVSISDFEAGLASDNGEAPLDDGETQDADADA